MPGFLRAHQDLADHLQRLPLPKLWFAQRMAAEHATYVNQRQMAHTQMLKSFAPKVCPSRLMK
jgi:hypothetical protein